MAISAYLDWNVFNKIEKIEQLDDIERRVYEIIKADIISGIVVVPYSNAHISDLARGYLKNPAFVDEHISTINLLTNQLCIVQYWGEQKARWHYRDPKEFLDSTLNENDMTAKSFSDLLYMDGESLLNALWGIQKELLRMQPVSDRIQDLYNIDPIFKSIFPRTINEMNLLALCEDIFAFSSRIKIDYVLYRHFQKLLTQLRTRLPQYQNLYSNAQQKVIGRPEYLSWDKIVDRVMENSKYKSPNGAYDKIFNLFTTIDLKGYSTDERFANMIDDALHCFYAAHCDYFVTVDRRCRNKAEKVFEQLKLTSKVIDPSEFVTSIK